MTAQQYDPYGQHIDPYTQEWPIPDSPEAPYTRQNEENDPFSSQYDHNGPFPQPGDPYAEYDPYFTGASDNDQFHEEHGSYADHPGEGDYYVSLEPCGRGSSYSMYDPVVPKCMIRLVGRGYQKDIELSLDSKMDSFIYKIFRCLEDEGGLDGVRLQGLPKKNCLKSCLAAICSPFTALLSPKPICCLPRHHCTHCIWSDLSPRRSSRDTIQSLGRRRLTTSSLKHHRHSNEANGKVCRSARVCQGPNRDDCVLIKISPSLPKVGGHEVKKRSTGVGTNDSPELENLLHGGNKNRCLKTKKCKVCVCPHCCNLKRLKNCLTAKHRGGVPSRPPKTRRGPHNEHSIKETSKPAQEEWSSRPYYEQESEPQYSTDMVKPSEEKRSMINSEKDDDHFGFNRERKHSSVNYALVKPSSPRGNADYFEPITYISSSKDLRETGPSISDNSTSSECSAPSKLQSLYHPYQSGKGTPKEPPKPFNVTKENSSEEKADVMSEVLQLAVEILGEKHETSTGSDEVPEDAHQESSSELNPIYLSNDWHSDSSTDSVISSDSILCQNSCSSKSTIIDSHGEKSSFGESSDLETANNRFEKFKIYLESVKKSEPTDFVPIELSKKHASVRLNGFVQ